MKKLLLFAGLPGVGKSTISKVVSEKLSAEIVDLDDFKKVDVDPSLITTQIDPPELRWLYYQKALEHVFSLFDQGVSIVIMVEVFHLRSLRSQLEILCTKKAVQILWVEVRCSYSIIKERLQSNGREGHILSTKEALKMHLMFKDIFENFSTCTQNHLIINNTEDIDVDGLVDKVLEMH